MLEVGAHQEWWPLLQALFMIARVLPVTNTTAATTIHKGVFIATTLLRVPRNSRNARIIVAQMDAQ
jgi:hypothetical protein